METEARSEMCSYSTTELVKNLRRCLEQGNTKYVLNMILDQQHHEEIKNGSWDIIPVVTEYLTSEKEKNNVEVFKCCERVLDIIGAKSNPEDAVLQFISEIEDAKDDRQFLSLLWPLQQVLTRITCRRDNFLAWSFNAIKSYLKKCVVPQESNLVGKEKLLLDTCESTMKLLNLYSNVDLFYEKFLNEGECKAVVCKFLIDLLDKPLALLDMEIFNEIKSKARIIGGKILAKVIVLIPDLMPLTELRFDKEKNELTNPSNLGLAVAFYLLYAEGEHIARVPNVYSPVYQFQNTLYLVYTLLEEENQMSTEKGLKLAKYILQNIKGIKLSCTLLDSPDHSKFCRVISNTIVFNQLEYLRKDALSIFGLYLKSFETRGIYLLIYNLMSVVNHSGLTGYIISLFKDLLAKEFFDVNINLPECLKGPKLFYLLRKFSFLPKGEETDLIDSSDRIIATLNLLRYLALRDAQNESQIWDYFDILNLNYLEPLRNAICLSKAHYELKIKEVVEENQIKNVNDVDRDVSVSVYGRELQKMSTEEKINVLRSSLTCLDVIDSILCRLVECIELRKMSHK